jgi:hypothetical protein
MAKGRDEIQNMVQKKKREKVNKEDLGNRVFKLEARKQGCKLHNSQFTVHSFVCENVAAWKCETGVANLPP